VQLTVNILAEKQPALFVVYTIDDYYCGLTAFTRIRQIYDARHNVFVLSKAKQKKGEITINIVGIFRKEQDAIDMHKIILQTRHWEGNQPQYFMTDDQTAIKCLTDGNIFTSMEKAAQHYGLSRYQVAEVIHGRKEHVKGLEFEFKWPKTAREKMLEWEENQEQQRELEL
jgi:hypothetical protein